MREFIASNYLTFGISQAINDAPATPATNTTPEPVIWSMTSKKGLSPIRRPTVVKLRAETDQLQAQNTALWTYCNQLRDKVNGH